jgi:cysteine-rich repeat protein
MFYRIRMDLHRFIIISNASLINLGHTCFPICGNGFLNGKEKCDDGNLISGDGCSVNCTQEPGFYCSSTPSLCVTQCGDGYARGSEQCDDGAQIDGDGCDHQCKTELGYNCTGDPSSCVSVCGDGIKVFEVTLLGIHGT